MKEILFLVKKLNNRPLERLKKESIPELTVIADYVLESLGSFGVLITEGLINISDYYLIAKQVQEEEYHIQVGKQDDWIDIVINNELQLHVNTNSRDCYNIELYAYNDNVSDDNRNWEKEFITATHASYEDIKEIQALND